MSTFVWHGGTSGDIGTGANWLVGGVEQAAPPTQNDDVIFDDSAHTYTLTKSSNASCKSIDTTGTTNAVSLTLTDAYLMVYGNVTFKSGDTIAPTYLSMKATGTLTQGGATLTCSIIIDSGVTATLGSNLDIGTIKYIQISGTFDTSASNYSVNCGNFYDNGSASTHAVTLRSSTITCTACIFSGSNFTVTSADHTITINSDSATANNFAGKAWGIVNFRSNASASRTHAITPGTGASFVQFNIDQLVDRRDCSITFSGNLSVSDSSTWKSGGAGNDDPTYRLLIKSSAIGTTRTVTFSAGSKTLTLQDVDLQDIKIADTNSPTVTITRVGDCGGNTTADGGGYKQNVSDAKIVYLNGASADVYWYSNIWATVSTTGTIAVENYPLPQDTAVIDDGSFDDVGNVIYLSNNCRIGKIDASTLTEHQHFQFYGSNGVFYGDINLSSSCFLNWSDSGNNVYFDPRSSGTITLTVSDISTTPGSITLAQYGGTLKFATAFNIKTLTVNGSTLDLNGQQLPVLLSRPPTPAQEN
jgi:hypothetical protein